MTNPTRVASAAELESIFQQELATDRWAAAETAFALAIRNRDAGNWDKSREWARQCLTLLAGFPSDTEGDVATKRVSVGGVLLPNYLHEGVLRDRFGDFV
ncbi:hypothetical protein [Streptomyces sp. NPDC047141]|uniref:hypothetical protein n=1 Tax=Streptomyces sp. NPDC047141 TaxID=3155738 RepID=UPI0033D29786